LGVLSFIDDYPEGAVVVQDYDRLFVLFNARLAKQ
jgi:hypothetical protein